MLDCGEGFSVRATRQNAPRRLYGLAAAAPPRPGPAGGVKAPGATSCVDVTVPCGRPSAARAVTRAGIRRRSGQRDDERGGNDDRERACAGHGGILALVGSGLQAPGSGRRAWYAGRRDGRRAVRTSYQPAAAARDHRRPLARHESRRARGDRRRHRDAHRDRIAGRAGALQLGVLRLPVDVYRVGADLGPVVGPVRPAADVPDRGGVVPGRVGRLRRLRVHAATGSRARGAGPGRGRHHPAQHDDHRRAVYAGGAAALAGALQRRLGRGQRGGTAGRRLHHRRPLVALGLLYQHPVRHPVHRRHRRGLPCVEGPAQRARGLDWARPCSSSA